MMNSSIRWIPGLLGLAFLLLSGCATTTLSPGEQQTRHEMEIQATFEDLCPLTAADYDNISGIGRPDNVRKSIQSGFFSTSRFVGVEHRLDFDSDSTFVWSIFDHHARDKRYRGTWSVEDHQVVLRLNNNGLADSLLAEVRDKDLERHYERLVKFYEGGLGTDLGAYDNWHSYKSCIRALAGFEAQGPLGGGRLDVLHYKEELVLVASSLKASFLRRGPTAYAAWQQRWW